MALVGISPVLLVEPGCTAEYLMRLSRSCVIGFRVVGVRGPGGCAPGPRVVGGQGGDRRSGDEGEGVDAALEPGQCGLPGPAGGQVQVVAAGAAGEPGGDREQGALQGGEGGFAEAVPGQGGDRPAHGDGHRGQGDPGGRGTRRAAKRCGGNTGPEVP